MENIELVIKIPEEIYKASQILDVKYEDVIQIPLEVIANSIPLPKGHRDLIDRDDLLYDSYCIHDWSGNEINIVDVMTVKMADAIIEAEAPESEE